MSFCIFEHSHHGFMILVEGHIDSFCFFSFICFVLGIFDKYMFPCVSHSMLKFKISHAIFNNWSIATFFYPIALNGLFLCDRITEINNVVSQFVANLFHFKNKMKMKMEMLLLELQRSAYRRKRWRKHGMETAHAEIDCLLTFGKHSSCGKREYWSQLETRFHFLQLKTEKCKF